MSERLKTPESSIWPIDQLRFCHPNTAQAEVSRVEAIQVGNSSFYYREEPSDLVRESMSYWPGRAPHQRSLRRAVPYQRVEQGETKVSGSHETYLFSGGCLERLIINQRRWGDCDGRLEVRAHYPLGWEQPSAVWLASRSDVSQKGDYWFETPNLSLLATRDYNFIQGLFQCRLLQTNYDRGEQTARLLVTKDKGASEIWGYQRQVSKLIPKIDPWAFGDGFYPSHYADKLRTLSFGSETELDLAAGSAFEGIIDCQRLVEAMRAQIESGPINLTGLVGPVAT